MKRFSTCLWCDQPFTAKTVGGHEKQFCRPSCKDQFHRAARFWGEQAIVKGELSVADLKAPQASYKSGASLPIIGRTLAHKSAAATSIYARLSLDPVRDAIERATQAMVATGQESNESEVLPLANYGETQ